MSNKSRKTIITMVPDQCYTRFCEELAAAPNQTMYECFEGDTESTKIWLETDGRLMSHMPPEVYQKEIQPISRVRKEQTDSVPNGTGKLTFGNGRGHLLEMLLNRGTDNDAAVRIAQALYRVIPLWVFFPEEMIETIATSWSGEGFMFEDTFVKAIGELVIRTRKQTPAQSPDQV